jgi:hypothetical protein
MSISYLGLWIRFIDDPVERTGSDFIAFYSSGRVAQGYGYSQVYVPSRIRAVQEEQVGFELAERQVLLYNHLPFLVPILRVLVTDHYVESFYRWIFLMIVLYITAITILQRIPGESGASGQRRNVSWLTGLGAFLFLPVFFSLMNGQDTAWLLLGAALWMYGLITGRDVLAGVGLSLTTIRPHVSLLLALPMLVRHRKVFMTYIIGGSILAGISFIIMGVEGIQNYIDILLISAGGEWHGMKEEAMFNLIGLLIRVFPWLRAEAIRLTGWIIYGLTMLGLLFLWSKNNHKVGNKFGLTVVLALVMVPHLHFHDLALLLIPFYELVHSGKFNAATAAVVPVAASIFLLLGNLSYSLQYTVPYLIMAALIIYPFYTYQKHAPTGSHPPQLPEK